MFAKSHLAKLKSPSLSFQGNSQALTKSQIKFFICDIGKDWLAILVGHKIASLDNNNSF